MYFVLGLLIVLISLYLIASPFLEEEPLTAGVSSIGDKKSREDHINDDNVERTLEDIEADFRMKKISEEDYKALKAEYSK